MFVSYRFGKSEAQILSPFTKSMLMVRVLKVLGYLRVKAVVEEDDVSPSLKLRGIKS